MTYLYPPSLSQLIHELGKLPGIGPKSAQRLAFHLLAANDQQAEQLAQAILSARQKLKSCQRCGNFTDEDWCSICRDPERDTSLLCVVEQARDIAAMERSRIYQGLYHVLGGVISPMDGIGPEQLNIAALFVRLQQEPIREVVMATNPNVEGEATALYLAQKIKPLGIKVSRIAHGLPVGGDLEYADEATLSLALNGRQEI